MHPCEALFQGRHLPALLPACDHYAGTEKLMRKSLLYQQEIGPYFDITFDCEDGAEVGAELAHAELVGTLIASKENYFNRVGVRVQDTRHPCFEQSIRIICRLAAKRVAYVTLPKIEDLVELNRAIAIVNEHAETAGRYDLSIHVLIESQGALVEVFDIAKHPQVACLSFGIMDFVSSHFGAIPAAAMKSPGQFQHPLVTRAKLEIAAACHAYGKVASHNVSTDISNAAVVASDAKQAMTEFGYTRMWSIHPSQITPILTAFAPSIAELEDASAILHVAQSNSWAPIQHNGTLHDRASYRYYWTILQRAKACGQPVPELAAKFL